jgi:hypothetical protein
MARDFRILSARGEIWISAVPRRAEAIFSPPVTVGLVVGTFAAVPYVHLHLEARRRFYSHIPVLVHDDASPKQGELRRLCEEYGCEFESNDIRQPACIGDITCLVGGLLWGQRNGLDIVVKMSRRFVPMMNWATGLQELALASQYPTYCNVTRSFGFGFRSECVGMAVNEWIGDRVHEQLAMIALAPGTPFVEAVVHNIARRLAEFRCKGALRWDEMVGSRPGDRNGYARGRSWGPTAASVIRSFSGTTPHAPTTTTNWPGSGACPIATKISSTRTRGLALFPGRFEKTRPRRVDG